jgi:hypothetical protein
MKTMAKPLTEADITAIANYGGKFQHKLTGDLYLSSDISKTMTTSGGLMAPETMTKLKLSEGMRKLNTNITSAKGRRTYVPRTITPRHGMKIWTVIPDQLLETWMAEMQQVGAVKESFAAWIWRKEYEKLGEEYLLNFMFNKYVEPVVYDASATYAVDDNIQFDDVIYKCISITTPGQNPDTHPAKWVDNDGSSILDGPATIIANEITAAKLAPVILGSLDGSNTVSGFQDLFGQQPSALKKSGKLIINCSWDDYTNYQDDYNNRFGTGKGIGGADLDGNGLITLKGSGGKCKIQPCDWIGDSRRLIITPKANMSHRYSKSVEKASIKTIQTLHGYDTIAKWSTGFQFNDLDLLGVNDQV